MIPFQPLDFNDRDLFDSFTQKWDCQLMNYSFAVLFLYRKVYQVQYAVLNHFLLIKITKDNSDFFMFPMGDGNLPAILDKMASDTLNEGKQLHFYQFCNDLSPLLTQWAEDFCKETGKQFRITSNRADFEYIYSAVQLARLEGHLLKPKRNQINYFTKNNIWNCEPITCNNIAQVKYFNTLWNVAQSEIETSLEKENIAIEEAFTCFFDLHLQGVLLQIENKIVAFSIGFPLNHDTFLILFEKADRTCKGAYTMINKLFAHEIAKKYTYINRAEDAGVAGLRKAKLSYLPEYLIEVNELRVY